MAPEASNAPLHRGKHRNKVEKIDIEMENANLQVHFEKMMDEKTQGHSKVAVLMLSWTWENEGDLNTAEEVAELTKIFEEKYHFTVLPGLMNQQRPAKTQINFHLAKFMNEHDDPDTLLIIYYAGHGISNSQTEELILAGGNPGAGNTERNRRAKEIVWHRAESLLEDCEGDMLLIFDCCHAGRVASGKTRGFSNRIFEVLGACQADELTLAPGEGSFSSILIWALNELASHPDGFTTAQLYLKVLEAQNRPEQQHPFWSEKVGVHSLRRLKIVPKGLVRFGQDSARPEGTGEDSGPPIKYLVNMSLLFSEMPTKKDITELCENLREVIKPKQVAKTQAHQIIWRGLFTKDKLKSEFSQVAEKAYWKLKSNWLEARFRALKAESSQTSKSSSTPSRRPMIAATGSAFDVNSLATAGPTQTIYEVSPTSDGGFSLHALRRQFLIRRLQVYERYRWILPMIGVFCVGFIWGERREHIWYHSQIMSMLAGGWWTPAK